MSGRRVVHDELGPGEVIDYASCGQMTVASVRFDRTGDVSIVEEFSLKPEIVGVDEEIDNIGKKGGEGSEIKKDRRKFEIEREKIRQDALEEMREIEEMSNETLVEGLGFRIRQGAGPTHRSVVFIKRYILKRMNRRDVSKMDE